MQRRGVAKHNSDSKHKCKTEREKCYPHLARKANLGWLMHVMRLHLADLKLWSASDRRTGGKAVPIKELCSDTAYPWYVDPVTAE